MKTLSIILIGTMLFAIDARAQTQAELWHKLSPEIRLNIEDKPWEFRWRPDDHIILPDYYKEFIGKNNIARTDIMLGVNLGSFKIFNYSKFDEFGKMWSGIRLDYNTALFNRKLHINIQERMFWGLNQKSENHYYLVQFIRYSVTKNIQLGYLGYGKWGFNRPLKAGQAPIPFSKGNWFMGPSVNFGLPHNFNLHLALTKDVLHTHINMTFVRLGYRINIKSKKEEPNAQD